jgi:hypothetical protein
MPTLQCSTFRKAASWCYFIYIYIWRILFNNEYEFCQALCCGYGSGIRRFFDPYIRDPDPGCKKSRSGIQDEHPVSYSWVKNYINSLLRIRIRDLVSSRSGMEKLKSDPGSWIRDPGSGILDPWSLILDHRIRDKHPGSATLLRRHFWCGCLRIVSDISWAGGQILHDLPP